MKPINFLLTFLILTQLYMVCEFKEAVGKLCYISLEEPKKLETDTNCIYFPDRDSITLKKVSGSNIRTVCGKYEVQKYGE